MNEIHIFNAIPQGYICPFFFGAVHMNQTLNLFSNMETKLVMHMIILQVSF